MREQIEWRNAAAEDRIRPPRFIYAWSVYGRPVTQALDSDGQVWESVSDKIDGEWVFRGWKKINMTRDETEPKP